jgi:hypothetical protein
MGAKLNREQAELRLLALQELKRRAKKRRPPFKPNPGQERVIRSEALIRLVTSGNGAGKTALACVEAVWTAQGYNPITGQHNKVPTKVIYVLDSPGKVNDKILPELNKFFDTTEWEPMKDGKPYVRRYVLPNGSELVFMFHEQEPAAFESIDGYSLVVYDEPPPRHVFVGLLRGGRAKGYNTRHMFAGTPIGANSAWMRTELLEMWKAGDKDIEVFAYSTDENKQNLDWERVEANFKFLSEKEVEIRRHGQWSDLDGLALAHLWKDDVHIVHDLQWDKSCPVVVSVDPHPSKKHMAIMLGADKDNRLYVLKELAVKAVPRDFARQLKAWMEGYRVIDIVVDNLGSSEMTGGEGFKSFIEVMNEEGVRARPTRYDEKVDAEWITRLQDALLIPEQPDNFGQKVPKLRVAAQCRTTISDCKNVQWLKMRNLDEYKPTLDISNKDALACLKYALACNLYFTKPHHTAPTYRNVSLYGVSAPPAKRKALRLRRRLRQA